MNEQVNELTKNLSFNERLDKVEFDGILSKMECRFSQDYLDFMIERNGGEGFVNNAYVSFWKFEELHELNKMYMVDTFAPSLFFIGSDGGGSAYAIRKESGIFVDVPFVGMEDGAAIELGASFADFLLFLSTH